jgi:hypothetical protein
MDNPWLHKGPRGPRGLWACLGYVQNSIKLRTDDIETLVYHPDDGSFSPAVKIVHHPSGSEYICDEFESQIKNSWACIS